MEEVEIDKTMIFNQLLMRSGLIIPYNDEFVAVIQDVCDHIANERIDEELFTQLVLQYTSGNYPDALKDVFSEYAVVEVSEIPQCVWNALTFYVVYIAITDNEDDKQKAIYSCTLQNCLIKCKGHWERLKFQNHLIRLYGYMQDYLCENEIGNEDFPLDLLVEIYQNTNTPIPVNKFEQLRVIGKYAWKSLIQEYVLTGLKKGNPYLRITNFLNYLHANRPSVFLEENVMELMQNIGVLNNKMQKSLKDIIQLIKDENFTFEKDIQSESSIILKLIVEEELPNEDFLNEKFTLQEFFVYLYYELLLESILNANGE